MYRLAFRHARTLMEGLPAAQAVREEHTLVPLFIRCEIHVAESPIFSILGRMRYGLLLFPIVFLGSCAPATLSSSVSSPLQLLPAKPEKGKLFKYYQPRGDSPRRNNWAAGLDFSGVSWNDPRCATLISPAHVVMAAHYIRDGHTAAMFHDRMGQPEERYIVAHKTLTSVGDIAVGKLNMRLPSDIKAYRFASIADATPGTAVITTDQTLTASVHQIAMVAGSGVRLEYVPGIDPIYRRNLIPGDSGHPTFLLKNGEMLLLETHTTGGPGAGPFYGDPAVQAAIRTAMKELGD